MLWTCGMVNHPTHLYLLMTDHVDCVGSLTLFIHNNLMFNFLNFFLFGWLVWFWIFRQVFFSFGSRSDVSAQTEKVLVFIHLFLQLHCPPEWQQWTIQILGILWFKKGARKLQHVLFSRLFCSLTPHWSTQWSYLYLEIWKSAWRDLAGQVSVVLCDRRMISTFFAWCFKLSWLCKQALY